MFRQQLLRGLDVLLGREKRMRIRTRQGALAAVLMLTCIVEMHWLAVYGVADGRAVGVWSIFSLGGLALFFGLIRSGVSLRWQDPSMAFVQMLYAVACNAVAFVIAGHARGITLPLLAVILMFGIFGMSIRQVVLVAVYAVALFSIATVYELKYPNTDEEPIVFAAYLVMVLIVLFATSVLTWRLTQIREHVRSQKKQLTEALEKIQQIAIRDELTSAVNRRHMQELLRVEVQRSVRTASPLLVAILDIDHFKRINDSYGHQAGDRALQAFVEVVQAGIRGTDTLARWGGEEFLVMLTDAPMEQGAVCMSRVRSDVQNMVVRFNGIDIGFTVSIGLTQYRPGEPVAKTIGRADEALYAAKAQGRNQVVSM